MAVPKKLRPPSVLKSPSEKRLFNQIVNTYSTGHFNEADKSMITQYVQLKMAADRCHVKILSLGEVIENTKGELVPSPYIKTFASLCATMGTLSQKLRISPSSRMRQEQPSGSAGKAQNNKDYNPSSASGWKSNQRSV